MVFSSFTRSFITRSAPLVAGSLTVVASSKSSIPTLLEQKPPEGSGTDRLARWQNRWDHGRTQWHHELVHETLKKHVHQLLPNAENKKQYRVLVPLCGKTVDMKYLATQVPQVSAVVGVDGVSEALEAFTKDHSDLAIVKDQNRKVGAFGVWRSNRLMLLKGDFFHLQSKHKFDAVWDRGAMVAIHPDLRKDYVQVLKRNLNPGARILISALDRGDGDRSKGPPYSLPVHELEELFGSQNWVQSVTVLESKREQMDSWWKQLKYFWRLGNIKENAVLIQLKG